MALRRKGTVGRRGAAKGRASRRQLATETRARPAGGYKYLDPAAITKLGTVNLVARGVVEGFVTGLHKSPYHGFSSEFSEHRHYSPGDDIRHLDWKLLGRTDRYYIKLFAEETNVRCYILLDKSGSMGYSSGGLTKLEYSCFLAGCVAYLMMRQQDSVGLISFDRKAGSVIPPRGTPSHLSILLRELEKIRAGGRTDMASTFHELAAGIKRRSLVIILSDLMDDEKKVMRALHHFRHRKHEVILFHILDRAEIDFPFSRITDFVDLETGQRIQIDPRFVRDEYLRMMEEFRSRFRKECSESLVEYVPLDTSVPFELALTSYLGKRARTS